MIPAQTSMTQVNELPGEEYEFGIGDVRWAMRNNADMYSNRELAVIREYSTNAFDANKEKALLEGTDVRPIEVTLPSSFSPEFSVRDHGYGMDKETLVKVYTQFGLSTKRDSNNYNGMLGYGSKSAVAYSTQFTVTSVSKGRKIVAVITRRPDWSIGMRIVVDQPSDEASGTEVKVPVHNVQEFVQKANDFYRFWLPGTVEVNGADVSHFAGEVVTEGLFRSSNYNSYIVMGNVPYRLENPEALFRNQPIRQFNFVAYVDTGDVEFVPNREALKYTDLTKKTLHSVIQGFGDQLVAQAKAEIASSTTHAEAYKAWTKWNGLLNRSVVGDLSFKGDDFTSTIVLNGFHYRYGESGYKIKGYDIGSVDRTLFVMNFNTSPSASQKAKVREYKKLKGLGSSNPVVFVYSTKIDSPWVDTTAENFIEWEDLKAAVPKKVVQRAAGSPAPRKAGTFNAYTKSALISEIEVPSDHKKTFWITPTEAKENYYGVNTMVGFLPAEHHDVTVIVVPANRLNKFRRDYPQVREFKPWAKSLVIMDGNSLVSDDYKRWDSLDWRDRELLVSLGDAKLDDPEVSELKRVALTQSRPSNKEYERNLSLARCFYLHNAVSYDDVEDIEISSRYPLATRRYPKDTVLYMNAKYQADYASARKDEDE